MKSNKTSDSLETQVVTALKHAQFNVEEFKELVIYITAQL
jgi:hypothetical protein